MGKYLLTDVKVEIDNHDLSNFCFGVDTPEESEQVDVSGFNANRTREFLKGLSDQTITLNMLQGFGGTTEPHFVLQPLYASGSLFPIKISDVSGTPHATFSGTAQLFSYNGLSGQLNARGEITATFKAASNTAFAWGTA